jgi:hypothetical protein
LVGQRVVAQVGHANLQLSDEIEKVWDSAAGESRGASVGQFDVKTTKLAKTERRIPRD